METSIITLRTQDGRFEQDMELPMNLAVGELTARILETLRILDWQRFSSFANPILISGGKMLDKTKTLDALGIWDGSIITIR